MVLSHAAIAGALAGLTLGLANYVIALRVIGGAVAREAGQGGELVGLSLVTARMKRIRTALLGCAFILLPAVGFALGSTLGTDTGAVQ
jgi:predicted small integral membrane protein